MKLDFRKCGVFVPLMDANMCYKGLWCSLIIATSAIKLMNSSKFYISLATTEYDWNIVIRKRYALIAKITDEQIRLLMGRKI